MSPLVNFDTLLGDFDRDERSVVLRRWLWAAAQSAGGSLEVTDIALAQYIHEISRIHLEWNPATRTRRLVATGAPHESQ